MMEFNSEIKDHKVYRIFYLAMLSQTRRSSTCPFLKTKTYKNLQTTEER